MCTRPASPRSWWAPQCWAPQRRLSSSFSRPATSSAVLQRPPQVGRHRLIASLRIGHPNRCQVRCMHTSCRSICPRPCRCIAGRRVHTRRCRCCSSCRRRWTQRPAARRTGPTTLAVAATAPRARAAGVRAQCVRPPWGYAWQAQVLRTQATPSRTWTLPTSAAPARATCTCIPSRPGHGRPAAARAPHPARNSMHSLHQQRHLLGRRPAAILEVTLPGRAASDRRPRRCGRGEVR
mmetsp:Transcript_46461/g.132908  ORF Transcript_46461/g.132908 Transcript_46461/m.132908 type:complete len:236 (-) Transcript_46461:196-903(-)